MQIRSPFLSLGPVALVSIQIHESGTELWTTDGTDVGTRPLLDLCPGQCSSTFTPYGVVRQVGIFAARGDEEPAARLWRSDGTPSGTFALTAGVGGFLQACGGGSVFAPVAAATSSAVFFPARAEGGECGLWRTDGSAAGTVKLANAAPSVLAAAGNLAYFMASAAGKPALWRSDGTPQGTIPLRLWPAGAPQLFVTAGSRLFFTALGNGRELWTSDGTAAGTRALTAFALAEPFGRRSEPGGEITRLNRSGVFTRSHWYSPRGRRVPGVVICDLLRPVGAELCDPGVTHLCYIYAHGIQHQIRGSDLARSPRSRGEGEAGVE